MVRTEIRIAAVLQGVWLPTSPQAAVGQVMALRRFRPDADVTMAPAGAMVPAAGRPRIDLKA